MRAQNFNKAKEKEKNIYSSSGAANSFRTSAADARSTPQSNVWNAEESTPRSQSNTLQKIKREKSPSELGVEAVKAMLDDDAVKERQRQTAPGSTAQYTSASAETKAAGNRKTAQYGDAAGPSGRSALYSSPSAVKPAIGNPKATPYGGAAAALYSSPAAAKPAVQQREKTPSERGDAVVASMLVDGGLLDPKDLEEYLASFEAPSARILANAGMDGGTIRTVRQGDALSRMGLKGEAILRATDAGQTQLRAQELAGAELDGNAMIGTQLGTPLGNSISNALQSLSQMTAPIRATPEWQAASAAPGLTSVEPDTDDFRDEAYGDSTFDLTTGAGQSIDPIYTLPNLSYAGAGASTDRDPAFDESVFGTPQSAGEDASLSSVMADRLASMSMPDWSSLLPMPDNPELTRMGLQLGLLLRNLTTQHWDNAHFMVNKRAPEIEIQDVKRNPPSGRADSENDETALEQGN